MSLGAQSCVAVRGRWRGKPRRCRCRVASTLIRYCSVEVCALSLKRPRKIYSAMFPMWVISGPAILKSRCPSPKTLSGRCRSSSAATRIPDCGFTSDTSSALTIPARSPSTRAEPSCAAQSCSTIRRRAAARRPGRSGLLRSHATIGRPSAAEQASKPRREPQQRRP
jgi:hypothetical protein